jgi:hypothetical protein
MIKLAGVSAGIDISLHVVALLYCKEGAIRIAVYLEYNANITILNYK